MTKNDRLVVVAMSGGVDSSVAAALLQEQGAQVIGMTLRLGGGGTCCGGKDLEDARRVAERLGIAHYVLDGERQFHDDVIVPFAESYGRGETPVPCVLCNETVKFRDLLAAARLLGATCLATGHYVRRRDGGNGPELWRGRDLQRDQSYFLFATTRAQLEMVCFPLGEMPDKAHTRAQARRFGLPVAEKPDSQDICFVPNGDYGAVVRALRPDVVQPGEIIHVDGRVVGEHPGVIHYTIGQRRGLGVGGTEGPLYVVRLDPVRRQVVVGPRTALLRDCLTLRAVNWLGTGSSSSPPEDGCAVSVQLRSTQAAVPAKVHGDADGSARVVLDEPFAGIAPGQACVFYQNDQVLGGGWICRETAK